MKKLVISLLSVTAIAATIAAVGCAVKPEHPSVVVNGGFESADLSGWTVEYGDAYDDDSVSSRKTFSYSADVDPHGYVIPVNQTGNWYLSGKGFDNSRPATCTGAIRSQTFVLGGDGTISMKLAGGALATSRSDNAEEKPAAEVCYVGIYRASDDKMIASQTNRYFAEDASNIDIADYENGTCYTDNFCQYKLDLVDYIGQELYIRIVDNDTSYYYGYLSVDDIRIGNDAEAQSEGAYFAKTANRGGASAPSKFDIANGGFETGNLSGWTVLEGLAFSDDGVNSNPYWWAEQIPYEREGNYHYGYFNPTATGRMRSSSFIVDENGNGIVTYKLGGCADNNMAYLIFKEAVDGGEDRELFRVSNFAFKDMQFPNVPNGMRVINMNQYKVDLSPFKGRRLYIEVVDENSSDNMAGCVVLDSVITHHETVPQFNDCFEVIYDVKEDIPASKYQILNGGFESGSLAGWDVQGDFGRVVSDDTWWKEKLPYNKCGKFLFSGLDNEGGTGTLTSSLFEVGGSGWITFRLGGAHDPRFCYVSVLKENGEEVARYGNLLFYDAGLGKVNKGTNLANMVVYRADVSAFMGEKLRIRITDNATSNWGLVTADSFITYYTEDDIDRFPPNSVEAINLLTCANGVPQNEYQVANGNFEAGISPSGEIPGWEKEGDIGNISYDYLWWNEWYTFNKEGLYFFSGFAGNEGATGTLTSSAFTVGGSGMMTYRLGGGMDNELCYLEVVDADNPQVVYYRFGNERFTTKGGVFIGFPITVGCEGFGANMTLYKADISPLTGKRVKLRLTDNAVKDWGLLFADDFVTYYGNKEEVPQSAVSATNLLPVPEFKSGEYTLNFAYNHNNIVLRPSNLNADYTFKFSLVEENSEITLNGNVLTFNPADANSPAFNKVYDLILKVEIRNYARNEVTEQTLNLKVNAINNINVILNGGFETGDLTGWTVVDGQIKTDCAIISDSTFWNEKLPYNKTGEYHFDGWSAQNRESDLYSLRSETFTLGGSGFISFKMGGAAAVLKVYKADGTKIAEYENTQFKNENFPYVDKGCMLATMTTYVADLSQYIGERLYIEICDGKEVGAFGVAVFDEIVTYYDTEPDVSLLKDIVYLNAATSSTGADCEFEIQWVKAINKI